MYLYAKIIYRSKKRNFSVLTMLIYKSHREEKKKLGLRDKFSL